jgi:hypothetical protein
MTCATYFGPNCQVNNCSAQPKMPALDFNTPRLQQPRMCPSSTILQDRCNSQASSIGNKPAPNVGTIFVATVSITTSGRVLLSTSTMPSHVSTPAPHPTPTLPSKRRVMDEDIHTPDNTRLANIELAFKRSHSLQAPSCRSFQLSHRSTSFKKLPDNQASLDRQSLSFTTARQQITSSTRLADIEAALESLHAAVPASTSHGFLSINHSLSFATARQQITSSTRLADIEAALESLHADVPASSSHGFPSISSSSSAQSEPSSTVALSSVPARNATPTHTRAFDAALSGRSICIRCQCCFSLSASATHGAKIPESPLLSVTLSTNCKPNIVIRRTVSSLQPPTVLFPAFTCIDTSANYQIRSFSIRYRRCSFARIRR